MNTIGRDRWPSWVKRAVGGDRCVEIKEHNGRYYAYRYAGVWNKLEKTVSRKSAYLGVVGEGGIRAPYEADLGGVYEYGHVRFVWHLLERGGVLRLLRRIFPGDWEVIVAFGLNRLIDPRAIKSMDSWCEKTYLVRRLSVGLHPKLISRVLETIGMSWGSQREFFEGLRRNGERIIYDGSVIFSESKTNALLEIGHNKDNLFLTKANIVLAFSHDRSMPVFFRVIPGSIHEINTLEILAEELGKGRMILVLDKGFSSTDVFKRLFKVVRFIIPLKRDSPRINYDARLGDFFMYRDRPIRYTSYKSRRYFIYLYEDLSLKVEEQKTYYTLLSKGKKADFKEHWAGKIALISNSRMPPKDAYDMWKSRDQVEKSFNVLQNMLETDRPYVQKEETFKGYLFASFIALIAYYFVLKELKKADINDKVSVSDTLLELSKIYKINMGKKEILTERSKRARKLMNKLGIEELITKRRWS